MKWTIDYISHSGVAGQKWGERKYQNKDGSYTSLGQNQNSGHGRYATECKDAKSTKELSIKKNTDRIKKDTSKKEGFHLTDEQKKILKIAGITVAVGAAAYGSYVMLAKLNDDGSLKRLKKPETFYEALKNTNPGNVAHFIPGLNDKTKINAAILEGADENCTCGIGALFYRMQGYDVTAGLYDQGMSCDQFNEIFLNGKGNPSNYLNMSEISKKLSEMPPNSYGVLTANYKDQYGGAHGMAWYIDPEKGLVIGDHQIKGIYAHSIKDLKKAFTAPGYDPSKYSMLSNKKAQILRCDNVKMNERALDPNYINTIQARNRLAKGAYKEIKRLNIDIGLKNDEEGMYIFKQIAKDSINDAKGKGFINTKNSLKQYAEQYKNIDIKKTVDQVADYLPEKTAYLQEYGRKIVKDILNQEYVYKELD